MTDTDRLTTPALLEIKRASVNAEGVFSGYASTWGGPPDLVGDIIQRGAFAAAIQSHKSQSTAPAMLWAHDQSEPIGRWLSFVEDSVGLRVKGRLTTGTKRGKEALALMRDGALSMSIGFNVAPGGTKMDGPVRTITQVGRLGEISLVAIPANSHARVTEVKKPDTVREFQQAMRGIGFSNRESKFVSTHGFRDLAAPGERSQIDTLTEKVEQLTKLLEERLL